MFIAIYEDSAGEGITLESAFENLKDINEDAVFDETDFYSATKMEVEMKLVPKTVIKINAKSK